MLPFKELIKIFEELKKDGINLLTKKIVQQDENSIVDLNTDDQLYDKGISNDGKKIEPAYTRTTISIKRRKGQPVNRVTLKDTGAFHNSFYIKAGNNSFVIKANDGKTQKLTKKYGEKIFGLTEMNQAKLSNRLKPKLIKEIKRKL